MPFKLLKQIVSYLRKRVRCPNCNSALDENCISVLVASPQQTNSKAGSGLFQLNCAQCGNEAFVFIETTSITAQFQRERMRLHTKINDQKITADEILDMHNLLKNWRGDIKELLFRT